MREVGARIRELRRARGFTLRQVARETGLAVSTLSNIESGRHAISLPSLRLIAAALSLPPTALLPDAFEVLQRKVGPDVRLRFSYEGIDAELLTPPNDPTGLTIFLLTFEQAGETGRAEPHRGWEYLYVTEGRMEVRLSDDRVEPLAPGDFVSFRADQPHSLRSLGPGRALMVSFATGWLPGHS